MLKFVATSVLGCCGLLCCANDAAACNCGCCAPAASCCSQMDMSAPMPVMPGMPGMSAAPQARAGSQYRAYSYQPERTYSRSYGRSPASGFRDATFKAQGRY